MIRIDPTHPFQLQVLRSLRPSWGLAALLTVAMLGCSLSAQAPDRYSAAGTRWTHGTLSDAQFVAYPGTVGSSGYMPRIVDVYVNFAGYVDFAAVDSMIGSPYHDPTWATAVNVTASQAEQGAQQLGQQPVNVAGYLNVAGQLRYAMATEADRGRQWQWINSSSSTQLVSWLATNPTYRPYCIDRVGIGGGNSAYVMLAEVTPPGEGGGRLVLSQTPAQLEAILATRMEYIADADVVLLPNNQFQVDAVVHTWGSRPRHYTALNYGTTAEVFRPGRIWAGYERLYQAEAKQNSAGQWFYFQIQVEDCWWGRAAGYVNQNCGSLSFSMSAPGPSFAPRPGGTVSLSLTGASSSAFTLLLMGGRSDWTSGGVHLPYEMTAFGAPNCFLVVDPAGVNGLFTNLFGAASLTLPIPLGFPTGDRFYLQFLSLDPPANAGGIAASEGLLVQVY